MGWLWCLPERVGRKVEPGAGGSWPREDAKREGARALPVVKGKGENVVVSVEGVQSILVEDAGRGRSEMPREARSRWSEGRVGGGLSLGSG